MQTITLALKHWASKITESLLNREAVKKKHCKQPPTPLETTSYWTPPPLGISVALQRGGGGGKIFSETIHFMSYTWLNKQNIYS